VALSTRAWCVVLSSSPSSAGEPPVYVMSRAVPTLAGMDVGALVAGLLADVVDPSRPIKCHLYLPKNKATDCASAWEIQLVASNMGAGTSRNHMPFSR